MVTHSCSAGLLANMIFTYHGVLMCHKSNHKIVSAFAVCFLLYAQCFCFTLQGCASGRQSCIRMPFSWMASLFLLQSTPTQHISRQDCTSGPLSLIVPYHGKRKS
eukprot:jgi/Botrbrau1/17395/Bobra.0911s0002.1